MNHIFKLAFIFIINIIFLINASATTMDKDKFVEANGIKIHYVEEGEGPPLLLIHGGGLTAKSWQGLAKEASRYFRVIMPDSRGHGLTNNPQGTFSYDLMTEDMAAFVKALKLEKPLVMGYSDGGMVVLKLTSRYPDLARAAIVGGDHFVTLPLLRAHAKHFGKMALVHFDAHTDTYANGCEFDHGTMFYTAPKEGLIDPHHSVQIGIRTEFDKDNGFTVLDACQVNDRGVDDILAQVKQIVGDMPVYLTFDIDCLDPAFAPGTGTPVIGGLTSDRAIKLVRGLKDLNIVGMDVVEVAPAYDQSEITALAAATLALEMLYIQAAKKGE